MTTATAPTPGSQILRKGGLYTWLCGECPLENPKLFDLPGMAIASFQHHVRCYPNFHSDDLRTMLAGAQAQYPLERPLTRKTKDRWQRWQGRPAGVHETRTLGTWVYWCPTCAKRGKNPQRDWDRALQTYEWHLRNIHHLDPQAARQQALEPTP